MGYRVRQFPPAGTSTLEGLALTFIESWPSPPADTGNQRKRRMKEGEVYRGKEKYRKREREDKETKKGTKEEVGRKRQKQKREGKRVRDTT